MEEEWRDIKEYERAYQVSNLGRVKRKKHIVYFIDGRHKTLNEQIIKCFGNARTGRPEVSIQYNLKRKTHKIYRLVAEAFIPNPNNLPCVNHIDGDINNCTVDNLEWVSYSDNLQHSYDILNRPVNKPSKSRRKVFVINKETNETSTYSSIEETHRNINISCTQLRRLAVGECINEKYEVYIEGLSSIIEGE